MSEAPPPSQLQQPIGKWVGRKLFAAPLDVRNSTKKRARDWSVAFPTGNYRRGVYAFHTHEEAEQWMKNLRYQKN